MGFLHRGNQTIYDLQHGRVQQKRCFHSALGFQSHHLKSYSNFPREVEHRAMELETRSVQKNRTSWKPEETAWEKPSLPHLSTHTYWCCDRYQVSGREIKKEKSQ